MLDKLVGRLTFDPLAFARQPAKQQAETLKSLVGLDFTEQDQERARLFAERTDASRNVKSLESRLAAMVKHADVPTEEVSIAALADEQRAAVKDKAENDNKRHEAEHAAGILTSFLADEKRQEARVWEVEQRLAQCKADLHQAKVAAETQLNIVGDCNARLLSLVDPDISAITTKISEADGINRKVRENRQRGEIAKQLNSAKAAADGMTKGIEDIDYAKNQALAEAKFPVYGISFDTAGVLLNGIPFSQASSAEQLRVSVAMGLALNPKLKVLLIRDGSLLDSESLAMIGEMAESADAQIWLEKVSDDSDCGIVIEDGQVQEKEPA
jgi:hypothetical protein